jgi:DNA-binding helix-hairpin-helix protein with protein kinase domain
VKVYRRPTAEYARKVCQMLAAPPALPPGVQLTWPQELVVDAQQLFVGYVMARAEGPRIFEFYNPTTRRKRAPGFHWGLLLRAAHNVSAAMAALHARGYVMGDVNESNVLVSPDGAVTLVDTDGFQVPDPTGGVFRARVGRPEFTPPELQGSHFGEVDRSELHDRFGLGVLIFLALMEGTHPFALRLLGDAEPPPLEARIRDGLFPYHNPGTRRTFIRPPRMAPPFGTLTVRLRDLFLRCFVAGHGDPAQRPSAAEWQAALAEAAGSLHVCPHNPLHHFSGHLPSCPWCRRRHLLGLRDPFPPPPGHSRARIAIPSSPATPVTGGRRVRHLAGRSDPFRATVLDPAFWVLPPLAFLAVSPMVFLLALFTTLLMFGVAANDEARASRRDWPTLIGASAATTAILWSVVWALA